MLSRVLIASDGSEATDHMMDCAKDLVRVGARQATLVHVFHVRDVGGLSEQLRKSLLPRLEAQRKILEAAGLKVKVETSVGIPFVEINRLAVEQRADLIVVGSLGASLIGDILLGSTAYSVIRTASIPVLLIRIEVAEGLTNGARCRALCTGLFRHILFPTDFSDTAERALACLEYIVRETRSEVTLLHVQDQTKIERHLKHKLDEFNEIDTRRLEGVKARLEQDGAARAHVDIPYGHPSAVILDRAGANDFTLILMGSNGRGAVKELFLGGVANNVARYAPLPVLLVPAVR